MNKKNNNRLVIALALALIGLATAFVITPLMKEHEAREQIAKEDQKLKQFFTWRDK